MLVSIAGSQGAGKTTIINKLSETYYTVQRKTSRSLLAEWNVTLDDVNSDPELSNRFQQAIIQRKFEDEAEIVAQHPSDIVITERTYADLATYALITNGNKNEATPWLNDYIDKCVEYNQQYDLIFYLSAGHFAIEHDGVRGANMHYSRMVDIVMKDMLSRYVLPERLIVVDTPVLSERLHIIQTMINAKANTLRQGGGPCFFRRH